MNNKSIVGYVLNLSTRKIAYSAIFAGVSAIIVIVLLSYTPFVTLPTIRISFEGLLIKICGYLFGITVGFFAGVLCEALVNLYRPTFFHWAYYLTIIIYGIIGGITKHVSSVIKGEKKQSFCFFMLLLILAIGSSIAFHFFMAHHGGAISIFSINISKEACTILFYLAQAIVVMFLPCAWLFFRYVIPSKRHLYSQILPIYFLAVITAYFVTIPLMPFGDSGSYHQPYKFFVLIAILQTPFNVLGNIFIILFVWKIIDRIIKRGYYARYNTT